MAKKTLQSVLSNGIIHTDNITAMRKDMDTKLIKNHPYAITFSADGKYYTHVPTEDGKRKLIKAQTEDALKEKLLDYYKRFIDEPTVYDVFNMYMEFRKDTKTLTPQSIDRYKYDGDRFLKDSDFGGKNIVDVSEDDIETFLVNTIVELELTNKSYSNLRTIIIGLFKFAKKKRLTDISISQFFQDVMIPRTIFKRVRKPDEEQVFTDDECEKIEKYIDEHDDDIEAIAIGFCMQTGLREGELSALQHSDIDGNILTVSKTEIRYRNFENNSRECEIREFTKGRDGIRKVVLTEKALKYCDMSQQLNPNGEYMFERNGRRIRAQLFNDHLRSICKKLGIKPRSMHKLRKTYASKLLSAGVSEALVIKQMGHVDPRTTREHYFYNNKNVSEMEALLSKIL